MIFINKTIFFSILLFICNKSFSQIKISGIAFPVTIKEGEFVPFEAILEGESSSYLTFKWNFGDGEEKSNLEQTTTKHAYKVAGNYTVNLILEQDSKSVSQFSISIKVDNKNPEILYLHGEESEVTKRFVNFHAAGYDGGNDKLSYFWDFGDGAVENGLNLSDISHTYKKKGVYTVKLTLEDNYGGSDYKTIIISVDNDWYGTISGGQNHSLSGGASLFYQNKYDEKSGKKVRCFKAILFYDDDHHTLIRLAIQDNSPLTNNIHKFNLGLDGGMFYNYPPPAYPNQKAIFMFMDIAEGGQKGEMSIDQLIKIIPGKTTEDDWKKNINYDMVGGSLKLDPLYDNTIRGSFNLTLAGGKDVQPVTVSGQFNFSMSEFSYNQIQEDGCEIPVDKITILDHSFKNSNENVAVDFPCIEVSFSDQVTLESITQNVQLGYPDKAGLFIEESISFEQLDGNRWNIKPNYDLRKGVIYEVRLKGGFDGILSSAGNVLDKDYKLTFNTEVDLNVPRIRVYQTIEDKPLVKDKDAMIRIQVDWEQPSGVAESHIVNQFSGKLIVKNATGKIIAPEKSSVLFKNSNLFTLEERRQAKNAIEIYGWRPTSLDGNEISIEIYPRNSQCEPDPQIFNHDINHYGKNHQLKVEYQFLKVGKWKNGIPEDDVMVVQDMMKYAENYCYQIYPIKDIKMINKGPYEFDLFAVETDTVTHETMDQILEPYYFQSTFRSDADVFILIYPFIISGQRASYKSKYAEEYPYNWLTPRRIIELEFTDRHLPRPSVAHEIGHSLGLHHVPNVSSRAERASSAERPLNYWLTDKSHLHIHGFRISGSRGLNRNCDELDVENSNLMNYMFPHLINVFVENSWITNLQYDSVKMHLDTWYAKYSMNESLLYDSRYWVSLNKPIPVNKFKNIAISGQMNNNNKLKIGTVMYAEGSQDIIPEINGKYISRCVDKNGNVIGKSSFSLQENIPNCTNSNLNSPQIFGTIIRIPEFAVPFKIEILEGNKIVSEFKISTTSPSVNFDSKLSLDSISNNYKIKWTGIDMDSEKLTYTLHYSPNGVDSWQSIITTFSTEYEFDPRNLVSGEAPALKIIANDGFNTAEDIIPVRLNFPLTIKDYGPKNQSDDFDEIYLSFSNPITPPQSIEKYIQLFADTKSGESENIGFSARFEDDYRKIIIQPYFPLKDSQEYVIKYGYLTIPDENAQVESEDLFSQIENIFKRGTQKQKRTENEQDESSNHVETPEEFFRDIFGLKKKNTKASNKKAANEKAKEDSIQIVEQNYFLQDVYGNYLEKKHSWKFEY